jgi:hypothetical protein
MRADLSLLDADGLLSAAEDNERALRAAEARGLEIAAAWAGLHGVLDDPGRSAALPGAERLVRLGGDGTPEVAEFAPAELGAVLGVSPGAAAALVADALDLRHRPTAIWCRVAHPRRRRQRQGRNSDPYCSRADDGRGRRGSGTASPAGFDRIWPAGPK